MSNPITEAIVFGGLEPFLQFDEVYEFISEFRKESNDPVVIYTGYNEDEIRDKLDVLSSFESIIVKLGRFNPNGKKRYDNVLGITLSSNNQYAIKL